MSDLSWVSLLDKGMYCQTQVGAALQNSVALTDVSPGGNTSGQALSLPGGFLVPGMQLRIAANGILSNTGTPTLLMGIYYGGVAGTVLAATTALTTVTSLSNNTWRLAADLRVETVGTSGTVRTIGTITGPYAAPALFPITSGLSGSINTGTTSLLTIGAQWGTASASNTITCHQFIVELLN